MIRKKFFYFLPYTIILSVMSFLGGAKNLFAQTLTNSPTEGLNQTAGKIKAFEGQINTSYTNFLQTKTGQIVGTILSFVGVLFLVLMIYAGILWMTAQGNEQQVAKAKGLLINSVIGIIIVFAAYAITSFIGAEILR